MGLTVGLFAGGASAEQAGGTNKDTRTAKAVDNPVAATPKSIAAGQASFQKYCRFCHGADAKGDGPMAPRDSHPPNLTDDQWEHGSSDAEIFQVISEGAPPKFVMKGFKSRMTATEIWNVVNYIHSLHVKASQHA
jgi:mono/diheme cytochrome c family protein